MLPNGANEWAALIGSIALVLVVGVVMLFPFVWMIAGSFKEVAELFRIPPTIVPEHPTIDNYEIVAGKAPVLGRMYINSLLVAGSIAGIQAITCSAAAFAFAKLRFPGRNTLFVIFMTALMVPVQLTIIPNFVIMRELHLINSPVSLVLLGAFSAFGIFLMRQFFLAIPIELDDAARIDGCNPLQSFWHVHLPLIKPVLAVNTILAFNAAWGDFFTPLIFLKTLDQMTLPLGISLIQGVYSQQSPAVLIATLVVTIIPVVVVFLFARRRLIEGIATTGLKS